MGRLSPWLSWGVASDCAEGENGEGVAGWTGSPIPHLGLGQQSKPHGFCFAATMEKHNCACLKQQVQLCARILVLPVRPCDWRISPSRAFIGQVGRALKIGPGGSPQRGPHRRLIDWRGFLLCLSAWWSDSATVACRVESRPRTVGSHRGTPSRNERPVAGGSSNGYRGAATRVSVARSESVDNHRGEPQTRSHKQSMSMQPKTGPAWPL